MKPISNFFRENLGAPLVNHIWSWGAMDDAGRVFLRVWQKDYDHQAKRVLISEPDWVQSALGFHERAKHIAAMEAGAPAYMVVCDGYWDTEAEKMVIESYRPDQVFHVARVERVEGAVYAHFDSLGPVKTILTAR